MKLAGRAQDRIKETGPSALRPDVFLSLHWVNLHPLHASLYSREGAFVFLEWLMDQHVSLQFVLAVECGLTH